MEKSELKIEYASFAFEINSISVKVLFVPNTTYAPEKYYFMIGLKNEQIGNGFWDSCNLEDAKHLLKPHFNFI